MSNLKDELRLISKALGSQVTLNDISEKDIFQSYLKGMK
jgi:hypothetical protein